MLGAVLTATNPGGTVLNSARVRYGRSTHINVKIQPQCRSRFELLAKGSVIYKSYLTSCHVHIVSLD